MEYCCNGSTESFHSISENFNEQEFRDERARVKFRAVGDALGVPSVEAAMFCLVGFGESTKRGFWGRKHIHKLVSLKDTQALNDRVFS